MGATRWLRCWKAASSPDAERPAWQDACERALAAVEAAFDAAEPLATLRLHGDCHLGNVLWRDGAPHVVDLDDAMQGPAVQDLWMLVSGDHATMAQQLNTLLEGYEQFCEFDDRERRLIEPLRTLRMLRHSAWLAGPLGRPDLPAELPVLRHRGLLEPADHAAARADRRDGGDSRDRRALSAAPPLG